MLHDKAVGQRAAAKDQERCNTLVLQLLELCNELLDGLSYHWLQTCA